MRQFVVLEELSTRQPVGSTVKETAFAPGVTDILIKKGALAPVHTPPLSELPGWILKGQKLRTIGIVTVQDFLDAPDSNIARLFGYQESTIQKWKREAQEWITAKEPAPTPRR
jgi:hypothetical protein